MDGGKFRASSLTCLAAPQCSGKCLLQILLDACVEGKADVTTTGRKTQHTHTYSHPILVDTVRKITLKASPLGLALIGKRLVMSGGIADGPLHSHRLPPESIPGSIKTRRGFLPGFFDYFDGEEAEHTAAARQEVPRTNNLSPLRNQR